MKYFFLLALLLTVQAYSQLPQFKYSMIHSECKGEIPAKLKNGVLANVSIDLAKDKSDWYLNKDFYLQTQYYLNSLLKSGKVIFGDKMNDYVNQVAKDVLIKSGNDSIINKIEIFILKSNKVNAVAMQDGSIFITVGLLAQIENEAQLAFTLAHEISHVILKHNLESYNEVKQEVKNYKQSSENVNDVIERLSDYSKQKELEADSLGYTIFSKAGYDSDEAIKMLYVLLYSHLPFDELPFSSTFFNKKNYTLPSDYLSLETMGEISNNIDIDDTYSTHPNIQNRIEGMEKLEGNQSGITQYSGDSLFTYINTKARFENQYLNLISKNFFRVVYESYLLKLQYPNNTYLDACIAKGLYGLSKFKTYPEIATNSSWENEIEGNTESIKNMYNKMSQEELATLAIKAIYALKDPNLNSYLYDLVSDMVETMEFDYNDFIVKDKPKSEKTILKEKKENESFLELTDQEYEKLSKVDKIIYKKKLNRINNEKELEKINLSTDDSYFLSGLYTELTDTTLINMFEKSISVRKKNKEFEVFYNRMSYKKKERYNRKQIKKNLKESKVNADSIVLIEPFYYSVDDRNSTKFKIEESIKKKERMAKETTRILKQYDKTVLNLSYVKSDTLSTERLNQEYAIKEWMNEKEENSGYHILPFSKQKVDTLFEQYGYKYILETGVFTARIKSDWSVVWSSILVYPTVPLAIAYAITPKYITYKYATLYDTNGNEVLSNVSEVVRKGNGSLDRLFIEDFVRKISVKK